jgi:hypothetical protein
MYQFSTFISRYTCPIPTPQTSCDQWCPILVHISHTFALCICYCIPTLCLEHMEGYLKMALSILEHCIYWHNLTELFTTIPGNTFSILPGLNISASSGDALPVHPLPW